MEKIPLLLSYPLALSMQEWSTRLIDAKFLILRLIPLCGKNAHIMDYIVQSLRQRWSHYYGCRLSFN